MAKKEADKLEVNEQAINQQQILEHLVTFRHGILLLGAVSVILPWLTVSGLFSETLTGLDFDTGVLFLVSILVLFVLDFQDAMNTSRLWMGGGVVLGVLSAAAWYNIFDAISQYQAEVAGNPFAQAVSINIGYGLYIAFLVAILTFAIGVLIDE